MKYILSKTGLDIVNRLGQEQTLCAFDFDGTLSSIVEHPDKAHMRLRTRDLLRRLATLYPCIVISGRARADAIEKLHGVHVARVIGNHGAETDTAQNPRHLVEEWKNVLEASIGSLPGLWVEDKGLSLAVHYRQATQKAEVRRQILAVARKLKNVYAFGGKQVINLVVDGAPNKGDALAAERDRFGCTWVLYVGDDENDEDAFALEGNVVSVRIGRKLHSHAKYYLRSQVEIDELIDSLIRLRDQTTSV
jgi:trehalose 6-phosphate phosphatase